MNAKELETVIQCLRLGTKSKAAQAVLKAAAADKGWNLRCFWMGGITRDSNGFAVNAPEGVRQEKLTAAVFYDRTTDKFSVCFGTMVSTSSVGAIVGSARANSNQPPDFLIRPPSGDAPDCHVSMNPQLLDTAVQFPSDAYAPIAKHIFERFTSAPTIAPGEYTWHSKTGDVPIFVTGLLGLGKDNREYVSVEGSTVDVPLDECTLKTS